MFLIQMIVKKHKTRDGRLMLAICDHDIAGKKLSEGELQIDLSSDFYKGQEMNEKDIIELFKIAYIVNLAGEKSVDLAIRSGIIEKDHIIKIAGVPHAQCVIVREDE